jgi:hypothetical protein
MNEWTIDEVVTAAIPRIVVPHVERRGCGAGHPDHWKCTRRPGHSGRHAAASPSGEVYAVWPEPEPTA